MARTKKNKKDNNIPNNDLLMNLPYLLLTKIIRELDEDIDRICFSLVCKRWFDHRDKYLWFNCFDLKQESKDHFDNKKNRYFKLNSFKDQFQRSLESDKDCTLLIHQSEDKDRKNTNYLILSYGKQIIDDSIKLVDFEQYEIKSSYKKIILASDVNTLINKNMIDKIGKSNVQSLFVMGMCGFEVQLPSNIKDIESRNYIEEKYYPNELERLVYHDRCEVNTKQLPSTLKVLKIEEDDFISLPPNLEDLTLDFDYRRAQFTKPNESVFPSTIKRLQISTKWLDNIKHMTSIETLIVSALSSPILPGSIPSSVTHLTLKYGRELGIVRIKLPIIAEIFPENIKYLKLEGDISFESDLFSTMNHLETLDLTTLVTTGFGEINVGELPSSLINLYMPSTFNGAIRKSVVFPKNLQHLDLGIGFRGKVVAMPKSIKSLALGTHSEITPTSIPQLVETIYFRSICRLTFLKEWPTVTTSITIETDTFSYYLPYMIPDTLTTIKVKLSDITYSIRRLTSTSLLVFGVSQRNLTIYLTGKKARLLQSSIPQSVETFFFKTDSLLKLPEDSSQPLQPL
ncbi:hypothetical protein PPL_11416 [Heterostelium album PN500]|uniref:F-box domain-containing protein n=1 Tax=Heterostelium pallidum (strain ATCC 26659 / Pp 5 / PN500) TaxID=670386 RepID=D3BTC3_HETP5|nr:hypothetical protein PPL_11416 [Heterostelium album PN500]EFA75340.1 hypothetical protein PPL_11416 [Heterostelium album PN500]|eukprot:XP_020427474.1 hypothetical protein PPL_11416 [Heterostelium album PN500]